MMDNDYFEKIPLWSNNKPAFEVLADDINGRIPVTRLEHWREFSELLESNFFNRTKTQNIFRGQKRFDWSLAPSLARIPASGIIDRPLAKSQLNYFRRAVRGRLNDNSLVQSDEEDELWAVGQHHGLMTPLLDWTHSPYVALFFAFSVEDSEEEKENPYRAVYVLNKTFIADDDLCPDIRMVEPRKDDHGRLVNQAGLFTFSPYDSTIENALADTIGSEEFPDNDLKAASEEEEAGIIARYICKIYIKNEDREGCMRHLKRMNVHHASLFPDLIGASEYCNLLVAEERRDYELELSALRLQKEVDSLDDEVDDIPSLGKVYIADDKDTPVIATLLENSAKHEVEPARIQLIAEKLRKDLHALKTVDWQIRDTIQSQMRTNMRITLRKFGYPIGQRDESIAAIMEYLLAEDARENDKE
jgi:hypothetical protein